MCSKKANFLIFLITSITFKQPLFSEPLFNNLNGESKKEGSIIKSLEILILDKRTEKPIQNAVLKIKNIEYIANSNGIINLVTVDNVLFAKLEKEGYRTKGEIRKLKNAFQKITFYLEPNFQSLTGCITDGINPLQDVIIYLKDENNILISEKISEKDGNFVFEKVPLTSTYRLEAYMPGYIDFKSNPISLKMDSNYNIFLTRNIKKLILEITDQNNNAIPYAKLELGKKQLTADSNGILSVEVNSDVENVTIELPKYKYIENIALKNLTTIKKIAVETAKISKK